MHSSLRRASPPLADVAEDSDASGQGAAAPPAPSTPVTAVRSTVLVACAGVLREHGFGEAYARALPPEYHDVLLQAVAGTWLPVGVANAHYATCDSLNVPPDTVHEFGRRVGERVRGIILGTVVRTARAAGGTPWTLLKHGSRVFGRMYQGGGARIVATGPKDARLEVHGLPFAVSTYYRRAFPGVICAMLEPVCQRVVCRAVGGGAEPGMSQFRLQWV